MFVTLKTPERKLSLILRHESDERGNKVANTTRLYKQVVERFVKWAENVSDIRAAIIIGSRARVDHPADEWADLDIIVITTDPKRYTAKSDWVENIGNPLLTFLEPTATEGEMERRVLFEGMLDVDFSIIPVEKFRRRVQQFMKNEIPPQVATQILDVFRRGMQVLLDKDGMIDQLQTILTSIETLPLPSPTQHEFFEVVNDFLYHAIFTAKHLRRGELWWSVTCLNCYMQQLICQMMEWHAKATFGSSHDTWFRGRFLEEWAHPQALKELQNTFAHYDKEDIKHALLAAIATFRWMAIETAEKLSYRYPVKADEQVTKWIRTVLSQNMRAPKDSKRSL